MVGRFAYAEHGAIFAAGSPKSGNQSPSRTGEICGDSCRSFAIVPRNCRHRIDHPSTRRSASMASSASSTKYDKKKPWDQFFFVCDGKKWDAMVVVTGGQVLTDGDYSVMALYSYGRS